MTNKIPYDIVAVEANKLIIGMVLSEDSFYYQDLYLLFIESCGWTDREYDEETLRRIDSVWDLFLKFKPQNWN